MVWVVKSRKIAAPSPSPSYNSDKGEATEHYSQLKQTQFITGQ